MEEKKLNFEKKLLSARHFTSGAAPENGGKWIIEDSNGMRRPRPYKSELNSGPMSIPGTVPFQWEQVPGRPKADETRLKSHVAESYKVPKLPPGRTLRVVQQDFYKPSVDPVVQNDQTYSFSHDSRNIQSSDENVKQSGIFRDVKEGMENCSSGNEEEEFVDALETLSRAESLLINCSLSGLSGLEDPGMKVSQNSPVDSQTRDFMMGRFLPAAKAMASETRQHVQRKQPVVRQQLRQLGNMVNEDKRPQLRYEPDFAIEYSQHNGNGDEESDTDNDEETFHGKVCGLLPGLGLRSSFPLLNPLLGISMCSRAEMPPRKSQTKTTSWACREADRKHHLLDTAEEISSSGLETSKHQANRRALETNDISIPYLSLDDVDLPSFREVMSEEQRSKNLGLGSQVVEKTLYVDTEHKVRYLHVKACASDANGQTELQVKKHEILTEKRDQNQLLDSSPINTKKFSLMKKGAESEIKFQMPDFHIVSSKGEAYQKTRRVLQNPSCQEQNIFKGSKMHEEEYTMMHPKGPQKPESKIYSELPAPPPLPKSPADSWLDRTLHSISMKNTSSHSYQGTWITSNDQLSKPKSSNPKWETMVRMRKMQDKHSCFSEDRLIPIPET